MNDRDQEPHARKARLLHPTVIGLGLVSLLTDAASEMIWPLLPVLLAETMHASLAYVGVIEGIADATASLGKYLVGRRSDRIAKRKPFVLAGYSLSTLMRPLLALAVSPWHALVIRVLDRVGKGLRSAPRDALIAQVTDGPSRTVSFGFHRAMDNLGAVIGPLLALLVLSLTGDNIRAVAWATCVPGALSVLAIVLLVREKTAETPSPVQEIAKAASDVAPISRAFYQYLAAVGVFSLANASDVFLLAHARRRGVSVRDMALLWAALNAVRALSATPGAMLAQRIGRRRALTIGWIVYGVCYLLFSQSQRPATILAIVILYGSYYGLTEGAEKSLVADLVPAQRLGQAFGAFALVQGVGALFAGLLFALLFSSGSGVWAFYACAALAWASAWILWVVSRGTVDKAASK
ncbi:MAG: MFS transporter [Deltaproteobacteria bacterium]|nr:MFS transporter [Deltaproteobacteria bacterium]